MVQLVLQNIWIDIKNVFNIQYSNKKLISFLESNKFDAITLWEKYSRINIFFWDISKLFCITSFSTQQKATIEKKNNIKIFDILQFVMNILLNFILKNIHNIEYFPSSSNFF